MAEAPLSILLVDVRADAAASLADSAPVMQLHPASGLDTAAAHHAVLLQADSAASLQAWSQQPELLRAAVATALVVVTDIDDDALEAALLERGVQAIVPTGADLAKAVRHAIKRRRVERAARLAYATDLATGLPHEAQLLEHLTQLLALREREPGPMALIVLRVRGVAQATGDLGAEAAHLLRRKIAVRLRSVLRAGDVVASIGDSRFGVLLAHLEAAGDGDAVATKLMRSLQEPLTVAGRACRVTADFGIAHHPAHGKDPAALLQRATAQALSLGTTAVERVATLPARDERRAANDDENGDGGGKPSAP